ncbi:hypothetical protein IE53DRAFT_407086 [Violaceomyces palustris]|uniref:Uncharacterized protein n=1 Tax=Violaceomyces palustris TaxID=1673888 RepID=A0ACD0NRL4_9BASI|nr:hypothetical protein IE53DRAFT_407086 [Violaceomyces palustris]
MPTQPTQAGEIDLAALDQALNQDDDRPSSSSPPDRVQPYNLDSAELQQQQQQTDPPSSDPANPSTLPDPPKDLPASKPQTETNNILTPTTPFNAAAAQPAAPSKPLIEISNMFPDLDADTIAAVFAARGGDQEATVTALLQMSDPSFKPSNAEQQTDSDAILAQTLAMEEQQNQIRLASQRQQQQQQQQQQASFGGGRGGGGFNNFLGGLGAGPATSEQQPSYNPNNLSYQPRVRKPVPTPAARAAFHTPPPPGLDPSQSLVPGLPGPQEAKVWQEEINRMAESSMAKAASTFSAIRQKAEAAFSSSGGGPPPLNEGADVHSPTEGDGRARQGGVGNLWKSATSANGGGESGTKETFSSPARSSTMPSPRGLSSPVSPQMGDYDKDPAPVGENELAKIIARGRNDSSSEERRGGGGVLSQLGGKGRALAERYSSSSSSSSSSSPSSSGWDQAGRTGGSGGGRISLKDNTRPWSQDASGGQGVTTKDPISLMDGAAGRGLTTSPKARSTPATASATEDGGDKKAAALSFGAAGGTVGLSAAAAAVGAGERDEDDPDGSDSDDLEYVSNPFEDED